MPLVAAELVFLFFNMHPGPQPSVEQFRFHSQNVLVRKNADGYLLREIKLQLRGNLNAIRSGMTSSNQPSAHRIVCGHRARKCAPAKCHSAKPIWALYWIALKWMTASSVSPVRKMCWKKQLCMRVGFAVCTLTGGARGRQEFIYINA